MQCLPIAAPWLMGAAWLWPCGAVPDQSDGEWSGIRAHTHPGASLGTKGGDQSQRALGKVQREREEVGHGEPTTTTSEAEDVNGICAP